MKIRNRVINFLGTILFTLGVIFSFFLLSMIVWGDLEASLFSSSLDAEKNLSSLRCPVFLSPIETGVISAKLNNPTESDWERFTRVFISEGFISLMREMKMTVSIPARGSETVYWEVYPEDAVYNRIIFFRIYVHAKYPYPSLGGSCGVIMMNVGGLTGQQLFLAAIVISIVCVVIGILLWKLFPIVSDQDSQKLSVRYALIFTLFTGIAIGLYISWLIALLFLAIGLLMIGIIIGRQLYPKG